MPATPSGVEENLCPGGTTGAALSGGWLGRSDFAPASLDSRNAMNAFGFSRREVLTRIGGGFGSLALATLLTEPAAAGSAARPDPLAPRTPHFQPKAKRLIFLFMNGGPSHVDTFDPKPELTRLNGQAAPESLLAKTKRKPKGKLMASPFKTQRYGKNGVVASELFPQVGHCIDDLCILRGMYTDNPNHEPGLLLMNTGNMQPIRPSMGSWLTYALGSENQNLPGYVVLCPGKPVVGPQLWSNSFLPGIYQGTHINNRTIDPRTIIRDIRNPVLPHTAQRAQLD